MMQLYSKTTPSHDEIKPSKETIQFLLDYSKQLSFKKNSENKSFEFNLN